METKILGDLKLGGMINTWDEMISLQIDMTVATSLLNPLRSFFVIHSTVLSSLGAGIKKYTSYRRGNSALMEVSPGYWRSMQETSLMKLGVGGGVGVLLLNQARPPGEGDI